MPRNAKDFKRLTFREENITCVVLAYSYHFSLVSLQKKKKILKDVFIFEFDFLLAIFGTLITNSALNLSTLN